MLDHPTFMLICTFLAFIGVILIAWSWWVGPLDGLPGADHLPEHDDEGFDPFFKD